VTDSEDDTPLMAFQPELPIHTATLFPDVCCMKMPLLPPVLTPEYRFIVPLPA
jgi:hypothetical protein